MRAIALVVGLVVWTQVASAATVVVLSDPQNAPALGSALQVTLAGRGVAIATLPAPGGGLRLDRAAAAQHAAIASNADVALWIDQEVDATEVCAVSADGRYFRHAPLPLGEGDTPRMFAAIATSLLDELLTTAEPPTVDLDVHLHLEPHGAPSVTPINIQQQAFAPPLFDVDARANRTLFEVGPMLSPITAGAEVGVMMPVGGGFRVGGFGMLDLAPTATGSMIAAFAGEIRHSGLGARHFDLGAVGGYAFVPARMNDAAAFIGARFGLTWEREHHSTELSLVPVWFAPEGNGGPGIYASLRWGFGL